MTVTHKPPHRWRAGRLAGIAVLGIAAAVAVVVGFGPQPALAHGGADEAGAVDLVEQALAIVVNSPDAAGEAVERIEAALAEEAEETTGLLDIPSLELAVAALDAGDLHEAEDALVAALGMDSHADELEPLEDVAGSQETTISDMTAQDTVDAGTATDIAGPVGTGDSLDEAQPVETAGQTEDAAATTDGNSHGLTERIEGGFRAPTEFGVAALVLAGVLAVGGFVLAHSRTGAR